jgi:lysophospholipase L1-like esterase
LAAAVAAVELTLRATHAFDARLAWTQPDPQIGYRFTPGREYWFEDENDHAVTGRINSLGWRDRERARRKPAGTRRVAVVGDSYVEAFQVELDSTFVAIAERALAARGPAAVEVMNFGRSGMTTAEELLLLGSDILPCDPDVVVLVFVPANDIADIDPATADSRLRPFFRIDGRDSILVDTSFRDSRAYRNRERVNALKQRSALVSLAAERYNAWRRARAPEPGDAARLKPEQSLCTATPDPRCRAGFELNRRLLVECARACRARGVAFVLTSVPLVYRDDEVHKLRAVDPTFDPEQVDRELAALADTTGFRFVGLTERFARRYRARGERLHWAHWNYAGHREVAAALVEALGERLEAERE